MSGYDIWVDFNDIEQDNRVFGAKRFAVPGTDFSVGTHHVVGDYEGNRCNGVIVEQTPNGVVLQLDLATFTSPED